MRQTLKVHPDSQCPAGVRVEIEVARPRTYGLSVSYIVTGNIGALSIAPLAATTRTDGLWQHTCFEVFVQASSPDYWEFNFAPSTHWAAYQFSGYRSGKRAAETAVPAIRVQADAHRYTLRSLLRLDSLSDLLDAGPWRLGLSAVLEEKNGCLSYWALVHPPGKPDFHHSDGFACELALADREQE